MDAPGTKIGSGAMRVGPGEPGARASDVVPVHVVTDVLLGRVDRPRNRPSVDLLVDNVLRPLHHRQAVAYRPAAWVQRKRAGCIVLPGGCRVVLLEGVGAARRELPPWVDAVVRVQADVQRAWARGVARDGGDAAAVRCWRQWGAQEQPFLARQRPWDHADVLVAGTQVLTHDPVPGDGRGAPRAVARQPAEGRRFWNGR